MKHYYIYADGIDGYEEYEYRVGGSTTEEVMIEDVRAGLKELGGGHADIFEEKTDELFAEIEV